MVRVPGEICSHADLIGNALRKKKKQSLREQKSAEGIVPKNKSGRPEHSE